MDAAPDRVDDEHWWTIDHTPMSEAEATAAAREIEQRFPHIHAFPVDPKFFMTLNIDRSTVQLLHDGLELIAAQGRDCGSLLEIFESWLRQADHDDAE